MKALLVFVTALVCGSSAFAGVSELTCKLRSIPNETFSFKMVDLGTEDADFVPIDPDDSYSPIFTTKSTDDTITSMIGSLEGQGGDLRVNSKQIYFWGDAAGIDFTDLVLYKNSNFTRGYLRYDFAGEKGYTKVSCEVREVGA